VRSSDVAEACRFVGAVRLVAVTAAVAADKSIISIVLPKV
jgi:hypothetical protein